jgi:RNA polymerase sigma factor (sigma-70 family)
MATGQLNKVIHHLRKVVLPSVGGASDSELLECFLARRDEAAFEALVRRHGPMVLGVCQWVVGNVHDADDAFQATFLVLIRKAATITSRELLGNWLYGVAYRTALKARAATARRRTREKQVKDMPQPVTQPEATWPELRPLLDQAVNRLPEKYRAAVVLCELEGRPRREVARQLNLPEGTLSSRLATARRMLARRLTRQGLTLSGSAVAAALAQSAVRVALPNSLVLSTVRSAAGLAIGQAAAELLSARVIALAEGVIKAMFVTKIKMTTAALCVVLGLLGGGAVLLSQPTRAGDDKPAAKASKFQFLAYEAFDGEFGLNWKPVRHDPTHVSLTKNPGKLTLTTQRGTIHADEKARGEPSAKNIFLIDNPLSKDVDFVVTTCISSFMPTMAYQQGGLIIYDDDDNYLKWDYEYNWRKNGGQTLCLVRETDAKVEHVNVDLDSPPERLWLRLTKHGSTYEYASSTDGKTFTTHGQKDWGDGAPKSIGFLAKNGGPEGVEEVDVCFEFFELRSPATLK